MHCFIIQYMTTVDLSTQMMMECDQVSVITESTRICSNIEK